jgi:hypothetical protein
LIAMPTIAQPVGSDAEEVLRLEDRTYLLRHLGRAETIVLRDCDVMRVGLRVELQTICASALGIISPVPLRVGEQIKVGLHNDVQRFRTELRGAVRRLEGTEDGYYLVGIELFSRLMPLDVMMLRRAGVHDVSYTGKIWV